MPVSKPHQCPSCGKPVDAALLAYSEAAHDFVCPACRGAGVAGSTRVRPGRLDLPWPWIVAMLIVVVACAATVTIVLRSGSHSSTAGAADERRAWEEAKRDKIIALKSDAEALVIAKKLPEAHAKYRELEKLLGGRTIQDPRLFDLVDQARLDQSRVYTMIMHEMAPQVINPNNGLPPQVTSQPAVAEQAATVPAEPHPSVEAQRERAQRWTETQPTTASVAAELPTTTPNVTTQVAETSAPAPAVATTAPTINAGLSDAQVEAALLRGVDFLISQFQDGELQRHVDEGELDHQGLDALAVYALLQASKAISHPKLGIKGEFLPPCITRLKSFPMNPLGELQPPATYAHSLRASALATYNRAEDREALTADVKWLIGAAVDGAYTYDDRDSRGGGYGQRRGGPPQQQRRPPPQLRPRARREPARDEIGASVVLVHNGEVIPSPLPPPTPPLVPPLPRPAYGQLPARPRYNPPTEYKTPFFWDNSNSQYGVLGVWAGAEVGIEVPEKYWKAVRQHWTQCQLPSGQWGYAPGFDASYSMTCGGIASLLIAHDYLEAPLLGTRTAGLKPYDDATTAGLAFLEDGDNVVDYLQTARDQLLLAGYNLFGLERVGLASGLKYFGAHNWFVELSERVLPTQWPNGAWGRNDQGKQAVIDTSYILLFLARGRHPVMVNKLRFDGPWTNRPRDIANLAAYAGREMERPVNWQVVDVWRSPDDWADAPILYLASNRALELDPKDIKKLREFVDQGGLLFTHADLGSGTFSTWAAGLAKTLFPEYPFGDLPADHPIYSLNFKLANPHPRLQGVSNGSRLLMVHSPVDLSLAWQTRATVSKKELFQLGLNLYVYTTGKERFRNRLDTRAVPYPSSDPAPTIDIAQLRYDGNWNPEPGAWPRFAKVFQNASGTRIVVHDAPAAEADASKFLIVLITGTGPKVPANGDIAPLTKFVNDGGTILIDACGGSGEFADAIEAWIGKLAPAAKLEPIPPEDELFKELPPKALRLYALEQLRNENPRLKQVSIGKGRIVYSALDIRSGLLGTNTWGVLGYLPEYSEALMNNFLQTTSKRDATR